MKGSIVKEKNGTYSVLWSTPDVATGKRKQYRKRGFAIKEPRKKPDGSSAREYLNSIIGSVTDGSWRRSADLTMKELLEGHWLPAQRLRGLRPTTLHQYTQVVTKWVVPQIGGIKVSALRSAHITEMVETLKTSKSAKGRQGLSDRSVQLSVGIVKSACKWGVKNNLLARDPVAGVERPAAEPKTMKSWTTEQAREFLKATKDDRLAVFWALLLTRGLRRGEVCGLKWENIDLNKGVATIVETLTVVNGSAVVSGPKTKAGRRSVSLDGHLVALLKAHKARQAAEKLAAGEAYEATGYLLADELGRPYHPDSLSGWFDAQIAKTELPRIRLHDCRHTAASLMLQDGVAVKVVAEMLGHFSPTITLETYAHVLPGMAESAGAALSEALLG